MAPHMYCKKEPIHLYVFVGYGHIDLIDGTSLCYKRTLLLISCKPYNGTSASYVMCFGM